MLKKLISLRKYEVLDIFNDLEKQPNLLIT